MQKLSRTLNEEAARALFDSFGAPRSLKNRWHYLHARIEARQDMGDTVPAAWHERLDQIEEELAEHNLTPTDLLAAVSST